MIIDDDDNVGRDSSRFLMRRIVERPVSGRVNTSAQKLPAYVSIPVILDLIVSSTGQSTSN